MGPESSDITFSDQSSSSSGRADPPYLYWVMTQGGPGQGIADRELSVWAVAESAPVPDSCRASTGRVGQDPGRSLAGFTGAVERPRHGRLGADHARRQGQGGPGVARMWLVVQAGVFLYGVTGP